MRDRNDGQLFRFEAARPPITRHDKNSFCKPSNFTPSLVERRKNKFARIPVTFHEDKFRTRNCRRIPISRASSTPCLPIWSPIQPTYARERNSASAGPRARCIESTSQTEPRIDPVNTDGVVSVIHRPPPPHCPCQISPREREQLVSPRSFARDTVTLLEGIRKRGAIKRGGNDDLAKIGRSLFSF